MYECRIKNRRSDQPDVVETVKLVVGDVDDSGTVLILLPNVNQFTHTAM